MILCDKDIKARLTNLINLGKSDTDRNQIIRQINPNTLDLTLGRWICYPKKNDKVIVFGSSYDKSEYWNLEEICDYGVLLHPGDVILGATREYFTMPNDICGQVYTKSSLGRVFINHMMAGVIDAGFEGTITLELKNEGVHDIVIPYGARVVQIQFSVLTGIPYANYAERQNSRYMQQVLPEPARGEKN